MEKSHGGHDWKADLIRLDGYKRPEKPLMETRPGKPLVSLAMFFFFWGGGRFGFGKVDLFVVDRKNEKIKKVIESKVDGLNITLPPIIMEVRNR